LRARWIQTLGLGFLTLGCIGLVGLGLSSFFWRDFGLRGGEGPLPALALCAIAGVPGFLIGLVDLLIRRRPFSRPTRSWAGFSLFYLALSIWVSIRFAGV